MSAPAQQTAADVFEIAASIRSPGWIGMPALGDAEADRAWHAEWSDRMRTGFGERWNGELARLVPAMLLAGLGRRQAGDLLSWQVWPAAMPIFATVRARVVVSSSVPEWGGDGVTIQPVESAGLGAGVQVHAASALGDTGERAAAILYAFDDGATTAVVAMEPTLLELLSLCSAGMRQLVDGMELTRPDGTAFRGVPSSRFLPDECWTDAERVA